jgi:hypothetical protein
MKVKADGVCLCRVHAKARVGACFLEGAVKVRNATYRIWSGHAALPTTLYRLAQIGEALSVGS